MDETETPAVSEKTADELKAEYDKLAAQCTAFAQTLPKKRKEIEKQVREAVAKKMGDFDAQLAKLKAAKHAAFVAWEAKAAGK